MRLTRRGIAVLGASVVLYVAGLSAGYPLFRALAGTGVAVVAAAVLLSVRRPAVTVSREVHPDRVERGKAALATLRVSNPSARRHPGFTAADRAGEIRRRVTIRALPGNGEATYHYELPTQKRGRMTVGPLQLERSDPLGLTRSGRPAGEHATLWVHPRRHPVRTVRGSHPRHHHEGRAADDSLRGSTDLRDVREYVIGDEVRHLHWKATARTGQLMVREYADPDQPRLTVLLDDRAFALTAELFEEAVEVAASILFDAVLSGQVTRLLTTGGLDVTPSGPSAARQVLDALCLLEQSGGSGEVGDAWSAARSAGGRLVVVGGNDDALRAEAAKESSRVLAVVQLSPGQAAASGSTVRVLTAPDAVAAVGLWNGAV